MRKIIFVFIFALYGISLIGQEIPKKPDYIIVANNEIITKEKLHEYARENKIELIHKGVSQEERDKLAEKFGEKIGDREFIIKIDLKNNQLKQNKIAQTDDEKGTQLNIENPEDFREQMENQFRLKVNDSAKNFIVKMLDGHKINFADLKGKVVLLNFWATWCSPCLREFTEIPEKILDPYSDKEFVFIPIAIGENKEDVQNKINRLKKYGVDFNVGFDPTKKIWNQYATGSIPKNFLIDKNGIIRYTSYGNSEGNVAKIANEIKLLLAK